MQQHGCPHNFPPDVPTYTRIYRSVVRVWDLPHPTITDIIPS